MVLHGFMPRKVQKNGPAEWIFQSCLLVLSSFCHVLRGCCSLAESRQVSNQKVPNMCPSVKTYIKHRTNTIFHHPLSSFCSKKGIGCQIPRWKTENAMPEMQIQVSERSTSSPTIRLADRSHF